MGRIAALGGLIMLPLGAVIPIDSDWTWLVGVFYTLMAIAAGISMRIT
jgi:hypothetical protein